MQQVSRTALRRNEPDGADEENELDVALEISVKVFCTGLLFSEAMDGTRLAP
jgi:hypothetical protein